MAAIVHALAAKAAGALAPLLAGLLIAPCVLAQQALVVQRADRQSTPLTAYAPSEARPCQGIAIVSPGAGGSEKGYAYLGGALASLGLLAAVVGHPESGPEVVREKIRTRGVREGLTALITDPAPYRARLQDIAAAREWARSRCPAGEAVLVGHSMGAATAMIEAGARNRLGLSGSASYDLYVALSPQGAGPIFPPNAWSDLRRPILTLTGTRDEELGGGSWQTRTEPFRDMPPGCKWLAVIADATHLNLAGIGTSKPAEAQVARIIGAFLSGVRRGDCTPPAPEPGVTIEAR